MARKTDKFEKKICEENVKFEKLREKHLKLKNCREIPFDL